MHLRTNTDIAPTISLILPAWNESEAIVHAIHEADGALSQVAGDYEIIVVDDGSTDNTARLVEQAAEQNSAVRLVRHQPNLGYGAALRSGFAAAEKELVVFTDADCQFDLTELDRFVLLSKRYDIVCGYRIDRKDTALRCLYSRVYNQLVRLLLRTGVRDVDCALKLFHRQVVQNLSITGNGFLVNSELLTQAKQHEYSVVEVGVSHRPRTEGTSTVSIAHIPRVLTSLFRYWWNTVQFPASASLHPADRSATSASSSAVEPAERRAGWLQWALLLVAAMLLVTNLGYPLLDRSESRYAEIPREMLATGNWVLPQLNFHACYDKPPLLYWLCAISYCLFGVTETAARVVPALAALSTIAATMWFGSRIFNRRIGLLSGVVLLLSMGFIVTSRYLLLEGVLSLFVTLSLFTAYESIRDGELKRTWWLVSAVCCGFAVLTEGPLAIALCVPPVFAFAWLSDSCAKPTWRHYGLAGFVVAIMAAPWLVAAARQDGRFLTEFFLRSNVGQWIREADARPFWFIIPVLLIAAHPWSFLAVSYAGFLLGHDAEARQQRLPVIGFLLLWSVWCPFVVLASNRDLLYCVIGIAPAIALMIGHYMDHVRRESIGKAQRPVAHFWSARLAGITTCVAGVALVVYTFISDIDVSWSIYLWGAVWTGLLVYAARAIVRIRDGQTAERAWWASSGAAFLLAWMVMHQLVPAYSRDRTFLGTVSLLDDPAAPNARPAIATVAHEFAEVPFYLNRSDIPNFIDVHDHRLADFVRTSERALLVVENRISAEQLRQQLPAGSTIHPLAQRGAARLVEVTLPQATVSVAQRPQATEVK